MDVAISAPLTARFRPNYPTALRSCIQHGPLRPDRGFLPSSTVSYYKHRLGFSLLQIDTARRPIHGDYLALADRVHSAGYVQDRWDTVFTRDNRAMGQLSTHFQYQPADQREDRRPARIGRSRDQDITALLYTSDAADDLLCVDLGGRRIIK